MTTSPTCPIDNGTTLKSDSADKNCSNNPPPILSPCSPSSPEEDKKTTGLRFWDGTSTIARTKKSLFQERSSDIEEKMADDNNKCDRMKHREEKIDEILSCLNGVVPTSLSPSSQGHTHGHDLPSDIRSRSRRGRSREDYIYDEETKVVDLWHLRQLAIKGGLQSANIRKRAWPKLVGANEHILTTSISSLPIHFSHTGPSSNTSDTRLSKFNDLADSDIMMIKNDIRECVWNIEEEIRNIRKRRDQEREEKRRAAAVASNASSAIGVSTSVKQPKSMEDASVTSLDSGCSSITAGRLTPQLIPEAIRAFPRLGGSGLGVGFGGSVLETASSHQASGASTPVSGIATPNTIPSIAPLGVRNVRINENSNVPSIITETRTRYAPKRKEEQALLLNIVTSVLRTVPQVDEDEESDPEFDDETVVADNIKKLYYYKGMHNTIAPLLITLESPSLTSLIFKQLSQSHLKDAMGSTFENIQAGIRLIFMPLLQKCDKSLHDYILRGGVADPCVFALPWVLCWFANDISNYDIISRLFDVFLASHASFPVYLSVALLTHQASKSIIMMTPCETKGLISVLSTLPSSVASGSNALDSFEDMIETAVSYMRSTPIQDILPLAKLYENDSISKSLKLANSVKMLKKPPFWAYASATSTDWTLIQQAKMIRGLSPKSRLKKKKELIGKKQRLNRLDSQPFVHNLALDASGLSQSLKDSIRDSKKASHRNIKLLFLLLSIGVGIMMLLFKKYTSDMTQTGVSEIQTNHIAINVSQAEEIKVLNIDHVQISNSDTDKEPKEEVMVEIQAKQTQTQRVRMSNKDVEKVTATVRRTESSNQISADMNTADEPPINKKILDEEIGLDSSIHVVQMTRNEHRGISTPPITPNTNSNEVHIPIKKTPSENIGIQGNNRAAQTRGNGPRTIFNKMKRYLNHTKTFLSEDPDLLFIYQ
mmetsp:Transcript_11624/g.17623  ORF Transcript_11624/g.17623 Transcript_11624/m.17623 type:complete len:939 (-) Transcript_11624:223-3039(-)